MGWIPAKAWTSEQPVNGYRHFERVMTGGRGPKRWVELAAVLDSTVRLRVLWSELKDRSHWLSGWQPIVDLEGGEAPTSVNPDPAATHETP
ncbi:MAG: TIGR02450 family Trp-rich protein [Synechococcus sp.]